MEKTAHRQSSLPRTPSASEALFILVKRAWCTSWSVSSRLACLAGIPLALCLFFLFLDGISHEFLVRKKWKKRRNTTRTENKNAGRHVSLALSVTLKTAAMFSLFVAVVFLSDENQAECCSRFTVRLLLRAGVYTCAFLIGFWTSATTNDIWEYSTDKQYLLDGSEHLHLRKADYMILHTILGALALVFCKFTFSTKN